ncbi:MAG TPA: DUF3307 domain-containing protein [Puia sp.]|jgi:hypothetical protein|nr:DUF3307 domain-containing protein [Puia sp.]
MIPSYLWLTKLILSHLLTDFVLQPTSWVEDRGKKHFASLKLYLHATVTAGLAYIFIGWQYWLIALVIFITHLFIDGWKSYLPGRITYFLIDQLLHLLVIFGCWIVWFNQWSFIGNRWQRLNSDLHVWILLTALVFVTFPAGILIGQLTSRWSEKIDDPENSLANAGKWIGIIERVIVLLLVLQSQWTVMGLLVTAKGIIRFSEKDRQEAKTEYLVIGTLLSIGVAMLTGLAVKVLS